MSRKLNTVETEQTNDRLTYVKPTNENNYFLAYNALQNSFMILTICRK